MKLKLFHVKSGNMKTKFDSLESDVNDWFAQNPNVTIDNTHYLTQPNVAWSHVALAIWYTDG